MGSLAPGKLSGVRSGMESRLYVLCTQGWLYTLVVYKNTGSFPTVPEQWLGKFHREQQRLRETRWHSGTDIHLCRSDCHCAYVQRGENRADAGSGRKERHTGRQGCDWVRNTGRSWVRKGLRLPPSQRARQRATVEQKGGGNLWDRRC